MEKTNPDLRKETNQAVREVEGEVKGVILLVTDCEKTTGLVAGPQPVLVNMLAQAMMNDPSLVELIKAASAVAMINSLKSIKAD